LPDASAEMGFMPSFVERPDNSRLRCAIDTYCGGRAVARLVAAWAQASPAFPRNPSS